MHVRLRYWISLWFFLSICATSSSEITSTVTWSAQNLNTCAEYQASSTACKCYSFDAYSNACISSPPSPALVSSSTAQTPVACTSKPFQQFACTSGTLNDPNCNCQSTCQQIDTGWGASAQNNDARCMFSMLALEDTWVSLNFNFELKDGSGNPIATSTSAQNALLKCPDGLQQTFKVTIRSYYGMFELYGLRALCKFSTQTCTYQASEIQKLVSSLQSGSIPQILNFSKYSNYEDIEVLGTYEEVYNSISNILYRSNLNQNSLRLKNKYYNPLASQQRPYEELEYKILSTNCSSNNLVLINISVLVGIVDIDDAPAIVNPSSTYTTPKTCTSNDLTYECNFGQFYAFEDSSQITRVGGFTIADVDLFESCTSVDQFCNALDVNVETYIGFISLNSVSGLTIYQDTSTKQGFIGSITASQLAINPIQYQTRLQGLGPGVQMTYYNTQNGQNSQFVTLKVSDQGSTGFTGNPQTTSSSVNVTIVAVNNAPTITINLYKNLFNAVENVPILFTGILIQDVDVSEKLNSSLAHKTWMKSRQAQTTLNQLKLTLQFIHGTAKFLYSRNLRIIQAQGMELLTIKPNFYGDDVCRTLPILYSLHDLTSSGVKTMVTYDKVCAYSNAGTSQCLTGQELTCSCLIDNFCNSESYITLYLNTSKQLMFTDSSGSFHKWGDVLADILENSNKTCGGLPFFAHPNDFSYGIPCKADSDCYAVEACVPGQTCRCCADLATVCTSNADCNTLSPGSLCGCMRDNQGTGLCGQYCLDAGLTMGCTSNIVQIGSVLPRYYGSKCSYRAPFPNSLLYGSNTPELRSCLSPSFVVNGSVHANALNLVSAEVATEGSTKVSITADLVDMQRVLSNIQYTTIQHFNRLWRPPASSQGLDFDPAANIFDRMTVEVEDLGNSGGTELVNNRVSSTVDILVAAVNNKPSANGPAKIFATEDNPYHFNGTLNISDPDYLDYGFSSRILYVNLSCSHCRLYLNETFLRSALVQKKIQMKFWNGVEQRGYYWMFSNGGPPKFGDGCQFIPQCSDNSTFRSPDSPWGFFKSAKYGVVYSPLTSGGPSVGCGVCPADTGNRFISIEGTFENINRALSLVTYLPDPNFNTETGIQERLILQVDDNGAIGDNVNAPALTDELQIVVDIKAVNDRPIIGRKVSSPRQIFPYDGGRTLPTSVFQDKILPINQSMYSLCMNLPPASQQYYSLCGPTQREYIDVDEDTPFIILSDVLYIDDVDSGDALLVSSPRQFCCAADGPNGCVCGEPCTCNQPPVCLKGSIAGTLLIQLKVINGMLTFLPPPGRQFIPGIEILTNSTATSMPKGGSMVPCSNIVACTVNVSEINFRTTVANFQQAMDWNFLSYQGKPNFFGRDFLSIWVSDEGFTDNCYTPPLAQELVLDIRVVGINDPPVISATNQVLVYDKGRRCYSDFMLFPVNPDGMSTNCVNASSSLVPPRIFGSSVYITDVDMNYLSYANMTLTLKIGDNPALHQNAGQFFFPEVTITANNWYEMYRDSTGILTMVIQGKMESINQLLAEMRYDASPSFQGYVPFQIIADDMKNYGECSGNHICGADFPCINHNLAGSHVPVLVGLTTTVLDATVVTPGSCVSTTCRACNQEPGCGWCPSICSFQGGKCIARSNSGPKFESCPVDPVTGRKFMECQVPGSNWLVPTVAVLVSVFLLAFGSFCFMQWIRKRHGSFMQYIRRKQADLQRAGRKAHILPPETANYNKFFFLILIIVITITAFMLIYEPQLRCQFDQSFTLDRASSLYLSMDNCMVRFIPSYNQPYPDNQLTSLKVQIALTKDPLIKLATDNCNYNSTISISNEREISKRYSNYICNMQIIVPNRFVLPQTTIYANGQNVTKVRAGPMDQDTQNFGLDFGPNTFSLVGNYLEARVQNLSCKSLVYSVTHGSLLGVDVRATQGSFSSDDADLILTSQVMTSVQFWQKSSNAVCLSAANGSLYVDNSCKRVCKYRNLAENIQPVIPNRRRLLGSFSSLPWICSPLANGTLNCTHYDPVAAAIADECPVGAMYKFKSQVPQIPGCYDLQTCTLNQSAQCLCKPECDMKNLNPPGLCDTSGRCCQTVCGGYSGADMFPNENMPRCGILVDKVKYPYCNGTLTQQWKFTSNSGQIAVTVSANSTGSNNTVSSYQGSQPSPTLPVTIDIPTSDKKTLNQLFHPGGSVVPNYDRFQFQMSGPGAPEPSVGIFVWLSNVRYLAIPSWIYSLLSLNLLTPTTGSVLLHLSPAFCPAFVSSTSEAFYSRLVQIEKLLVSTLQTYPASSSSKPLPVSSLIMFHRVGAHPILFATDPNTNVASAKEVKPLDYNLIISIVLIAVIFPAVVSFIAALLAFRFGSKYLKDFRSLKVKEEYMISNVKQLFIGIEEYFDEGLIEYKMKYEEMVGRSNWFYMFETFVWGADAQRSLLAELWIVFVEILAFMLPAILIYVVAEMTSAEYLAFRCDLRADYCNCMGEKDSILYAFIAVEYIAISYVCIGFLELVLYYLSLPFDSFRKLIRYVFYSLLFFMGWFVLSVFSMVVLFIFLGVLFKPAFVIPYGIAIVGTFSASASLHAKLMKLRIRVQTGIIKKVELERKKLNNIPPALSELLIRKNFEQALHDNGLSISRITLTVFGFVCLIASIYAFVFIGFNAFTSPGDVIASYVNSAISIGISLVTQQVLASEGEEEDVRNKVDDVQDKIMKSLKGVLRMVSKQIHLAMKLYTRLKVSGNLEVAKAE